MDFFFGSNEYFLKEKNNTNHLIRIKYYYICMSLRYISLGHRCHIGQILKQNNLTNEALPFDNVIYSFAGVVDCIQTKFHHFFPKRIKCEYVFVGKQHPEADKNGNRKLFRGRYGCFTHHDLNNTNVIQAFKRRMQRFHQYLSVPNEIIFIRTVMEDGEINMLPNFIHTVKKMYPQLRFKIFLVYDNKNIPETILKYNDCAYIVNSVMTTTDQNSKTNSNGYMFLINYLKNIKKLNDINIHESFHHNNNNIEFKNDSYKGYAITNLLPYDFSN